MKHNNRSNCAFTRQTGERALTCILMMATVSLTVSCSDDAEYITSILKRPVDLAVTCRSAEDGSYLSVDKCGDEGVNAVSWVLDGDSNGVFVSTLPDGAHYDFDPYFPGYSPIPVGPGATRIVAAPDSKQIYVAVGNSVGEAPEIVRISGDFLNLKGVVGRHPLPCKVTDIAVTEGDSYPLGYAMAALLACEGGSELWSLIPVDPDTAPTSADFITSSKLCDVPGDARWISAGGDTLLAVSRSLPDSAFNPGAVMKWDFLVSIKGFQTGTCELQAVPVINDSQFATVTVTEGVRFGCDSRQAGGVSGYVSGRAAMSPDGRFIYVPMSVPAGLAVFDGSLVRVDTHEFIEQDTIDSTVESTSWQIANMYFQWLGYKDIRMDSPVAGVTFVQIESGLRAIAWLYGGEIVRVLVDPVTVEDDDGNPVELPWPHRAENDALDIESSAYQPIIRYQGEDITRGILTRSDLPSFGGKVVVIPPTDEEKYLYYGVEFNGDIEAEIPETWTVTYEGVIPGAEGGCGSLEKLTPAVSGPYAGLPRYAFSLPDGGAGVEFCRLGVEGAGDGYDGDILEVTFGEDESCGEWAGKTQDLRIQSVGGQVYVTPLLVSVPMPDVPATCLSKGITWRVRASGQWVVAGSVTGFLHPWTHGVSSCVKRSDADPLFTGRAMTATPANQQLKVQSCPVARNIDENIDWAATRFKNPILNFWVIPGCMIDGEYDPVVIPPVRDTSLRFSIETGRLPNQNDIGGLSKGLHVLGTSIFTLDSSNGKVVVVNAEDMSITSSWF